MRSTRRTSRIPKTTKAVETQKCKDVSGNELKKCCEDLKKINDKQDKIKFKIPKKCNKFFK